MENQENQEKKHKRRVRYSGTHPRNYKEKYNDEPSAFSALSYDTAYLLKAAIEKAGTTDKEAVTKAIKEIQFEGITGQLTFDENNNPVKSITIIKIVNGDYTFDSVVTK